MSALVLGAAGAAAGFLAGGPAGAFYGFGIGYGIGALKDARNAGSQAPEAATITSQYGQPIPWVRGVRRVACQVWWSSEPRGTSSSGGGKGGPSQAGTTTYKRDVLLGLTCNQVADVSRIFRTGKLVWTQLPDANIASVTASNETDQWARMTIYTGSATQLPDPAYEAAKGVGNASAYRGRAYIFIEGLECGSSGIIDNIEAEVVQQDFATLYFSAPMTTDGADVVAPAATIIATPSTTPTFTSDGALLTMNNAAQYFQYDAGGGGKLDISTAGNLGVWQFTADLTWSFSGAGGTGDQIRFMIFGAGLRQAGFMFQCISGTMRLWTWLDIGSGNQSTNLGIIPPNGRYRITFDTRDLPTSGSITWDVNGTVLRTVSATAMPTRYAWYGAANGGQLGVTSIRIKNANILAAGVDVYDPAETLPDVVAAVCRERAGMPDGTYDVSALPAVPVRSLAATVGPSSAVLQQLADAFFFVSSLRDKLYFRPMGGSVAATIPWDDLAAGPEKAADQALAIDVANDLELPPQVVVNYVNISNDSQRGTETSDRITGGQAAVEVLDMTLGLLPAEAKKVADVRVGMAAAGLLTGAISLPMIYAKLDPGDVVSVVDRDGRAYRLRLNRKRDERGVLAFESVGDDASVLTSAQITDGTQTPQSQVVKASDTAYLALDIPLLRDADDSPGVYVTAKGTTTVWPGGQIHISPDNVTFAQAAEVLESAVFGTCTTTLGAFSGAGVDETSTLTVNVGNGTLSSSTRDPWLAGETINAALVGDEVIRFVRVVMVSAGVYTLSGLLRGQKGTEWAIGAHGAGERFVLLTARGMRRVTQQASESGALRYLKSITLGASVFKNATTLTNTNRGLKPLAPAAVRGTAIAGQDLQLTWLRRSRLSAGFLAPSGVPLGEAAEAYVCRAYLGSTLKRTFNVTAPIATYTRAQQVADGLTTPATLRIDVAQVSAIVGEGYIGTGSTTSTATTQAQVATLTLGGTFAAGLVLRVQLGSTLVTYTTLAGDTNLAGVATSLAAAIDATADYAATAAGQVVTVTGLVSAPYVLTATVVPGDNTITLVQTQAAAPADPLGGRYQAAITYTNGGVPLITSGTNIELVPAGITFGVQVERPAGTVLGRASYTTPAAQFAFQVHSGLTSALQAVSALSVPGYGAGISYLTGTERYLVWGPYGVTGVTVSTFATAPYGMSLTVEATGSLPTPTATPQIITATLAGTTTAGYVYRLTLGGVAYSYTASGGDTMTVVAAALAFAIDAAAEYVATSSGAVVTVTGATANVPFLFSADIQGGATTIAAAITQEAT